MASLLVGAPPAILPRSRISSASSQMLGSPLSSGGASFLPIRPAATAPVVPLVYCGRGDKKTAKGKRFNHSFGNARPRSKKHGRGPPRVPVPGAAPKKDPFEDTEVVKIDIDESLLPN
uniref:30S ribosomal protein S31, chloroplastic n=1 Tax=Kalanchoe fedtschenkoi TaxID=63787 RepID=A0A7N0URI4_KALFE